MAGLAKLLAVAAVGAVAFLAGKQAAKPQKAGRKDTFVLAVTFDFETKEKLDEFVEIFKPLAAYVVKNEPGTLSYELSISDVKPLSVLIFERYADKEEAFLKIHRSSAPFLHFKEQITKLGYAGQGVSYYETGVGAV